MRLLFNLLVVTLLFTTDVAQADGPMRSVSVEGVGRVSAVPDMAVVQFGVQSDAQEASAAMKATSAAMRDVIAEVSNMGVEPEDIQTTAVGLNPRWHRSQDGSPPRVVGYVASNSLRVTVRDLERLGALLDTVVSGGANTMNSLTFVVAETESLEDEARAAAVADAMRKARQLAEAAGSTLGSVVSISEGRTGGGPTPMFEAAASARSAVPIAAGQQDIVVSVQATFELSE